MTKLSRKLQTQKRHRRLRRFLIGDATRPRLSVFRSNNHIYAQVIDDSAQKTICSASTIDKEIVGNEAAKIRSIRPPEPYKGKGIKYHDEIILRKAGKSGKK